MSIRVNYCDDYYNGTVNNGSSVRSLCHAAKLGDSLAIKLIAENMAPLIRLDSTLVPIPSHFGFPIQTLTLAENLSKLLQCPIADVVRGAERESLYELKKRGGSLSVNDLDLSLTGNPGKNPVLIDFVFGTGLTIASIAKLIPNCSVTVFSRDTTAPLVHEELFEFNGDNYSDEFRCRLLSRLKQDCEYYLNAGGRQSKHLWANDEKEHIRQMKFVFEKIKEKPLWISISDINYYECQMIGATATQGDVCEAGSPTL